jgi:regulator of sigma E protease
MILLLSFLVLVHEAGHFYAARALGIKVSKFGFGLPIGPTLWKKQVGDIEVLVHAFLLGGYVSFPDDEKDAGVVVPDEDKFSTKPVWKRMIVISAGVIANIITAIVFVLITACIWGKLPSGQFQVFAEKIQAEKTESIWQSGLQKGDQIIKINGSDILTNYAVTLYSKNSAKYDGKVDSDFANENINLLKRLNNKIASDDVIKAGTKINLPNNIVESAIKISDADLFNLQIFRDKYENDPRTILNESQLKLRDSIIGKNVFVAENDIAWEDLAYAVSDTVHPLYLTVLRDGKEVELNPIYPNKDGVMGVVLSVSQKLMQTNTPVSVIKGSFNYLFYQTYMMCYGLWSIFSGKVNFSELHGIVVIAKIGGDVIQNNGFFSGLLLTAVISLNLALVNFLPIPALDGGHFMFLLIEKIRRKPLDEVTINKISSVFFLLLILLMVLVVFNDVYALIIHKF